jgi:hypothetical protein
MRPVISRYLVALPLLLAAACSTDSVRDPVAPLASAELAPLSATPQSLEFEALLPCPSKKGVSTRAVIGRDGGIVYVDGHVLLVPRGAVSKKTSFKISAPASKYLELDITADGEDSFQFNSPVIVRVNYARCPESALPKSPLAAWWIDSNKARLGVMPSYDDRERRALTFVTDHLSGYAIAYRNGKGEESEDR